MDFLMEGGESRRAPDCYFHPRCPYAIDVCRSQAPAWRQVSRGHFVGCHRAEELELAGVE